MSRGYYTEIGITKQEGTIISWDWYPKSHTERGQKVMGRPVLSPRMMYKSQRNLDLYASTIYVYIVITCYIF